jgi:hypothetical protein
MNFGKQPKSIFSKMTIRLSLVTSISGTLTKDSDFGQMDMLIYITS